ncbi:hypothetical protein ACFYO1_15045 [Nocardia sp. NPDC006044]|uniref:hypothetical protein n=1 Tax=Nocardia sp. NPDC006044 TaxID=3364306 RepID=UPI0036BE7B27
MIGVTGPVLVVGVRRNTFRVSGRHLVRDAVRCRIAVGFVLGGSPVGFGIRSGRIAYSGDIATGRCSCCAVAGVRGRAVMIWVRRNTFSVGGRHMVVDVVRTRRTVEFARGIRHSALWIGGSSIPASSDSATARCAAQARLGVIGDVGVLGLNHGRV